MLQFDVLSVLRAHSCAFWMETADVWSAIGELLWPAVADCAVRLVRVAGQCVRAKHGLHSSFWTSCYCMAAQTAAKRENCTACSSSFLDPPDLVSEIICQHTEDNKDKVNTVTAFHVPVKWNTGTWCLSGLSLKRKVYVAVKSDGDCSAASEPELWLWRVQDFRKSHRKSQKQTKQILHPLV